MEGIPILVEKKRIKNLYLRVRADGRVCLSAPQGMSDAAIRAFAAARADWLRRHLAGRKPSAPPPEYVSGERLSLWGRSSSV